jgi:transposase
MEHSNDNIPALDRLVTPEEIAGRISSSSGVSMSARTVWEKARRVGVSRKIGRAMLISIDDIPELLKEEKTKWQKSTNAARSTTSVSVAPVDSTGKALALLQKKKRKR